jgi:hypothetical protein
MITNPEILRKFEDDLIRNETKFSHDHSLNLLTSMWEEGVALGVLPPDDPLEGIDVDIRIAQVLNSCLIKSSPE